jgi:methylenetetrahydrofolate dehydrogenase (NADP+)/methenyltetrahydrofolate cyclohydrolase
MGRKSPFSCSNWGNDGASLTYVGSKVKACQRVGFESTLVKPSTTSETELQKK